MYNRSIGSFAPFLMGYLSDGGPAKSDDFDHDDPWHAILLAFFYTSIAMIWLYSFLSRWKNLFAAAFFSSSALSSCCLPRKRKADDDGEEDCATPLRFDVEGKNDVPHVTIQICTYNEGELVRDTIAAACSVDWPKLTVHVLDDSTDPKSIAIVNDAVAQWKALSSSSYSSWDGSDDSDSLSSTSLSGGGCGVDVVRKTRPTREGYKAGNLRYHFDSIEGEFVAYFDADHRPEPDFLLRTMPHFFEDYDPECCGARKKEEKRVGLVQMPWAYYNTHRSLLTEAEALALDVHHTIEQRGRAAAHGVFGFNGTGGVWRKSAIEDAGGWSWDTVTEDASISYLAHMRGYRFVYAHDCPQLLEVPSCILAYVQQKHRWTKGFLQVFRLYYRDIFISDSVSWGVKLEALLHLTGPLQFTCAMISILVFPFLVLHEIDSPFVKFVSLAPIVEPIISTLVAIYTKRSGSNGHYQTWWERTGRVVMMLPYFCLRCGMVVFETKAIIEGLMSNDATFLTTPKLGQENAPLSPKEAKRRMSANVVKRQWFDDACAWFGILLACHRLLYLFMFEAYFPRDTLFSLSIRVMNVVVCTGLFWVHVSFLLEKYKIHSGCRTRLATRRGAIMFFVMFLCVFGFSRIGLVLHVSSLSRLGPLSADPSSNVADGWSCEPPSDGKSYRRAPIVVFADPRTGSNLFFELMMRVNRETTSPNLSLLTLHEVFIDNPKEESERLFGLTKTMAEACPSSDLALTQHMLKPWTDKGFYGRLDFPDYLKKAGRGNWTATRPLVKKFESRVDRPIEFLDFVNNIPSAKRNSYFVFKMFPFYMRDTGLKPADLVRPSEHPRAKYIVIYRRRIIESFVSHRIATTTGHWTDANTTSERVFVPKEELEHFIRSKRVYYANVRRALEIRNVPYEVFEYDRDLRSLEDQERTLIRITKILGVQGMVDHDSVLGGLKRKKQAQVPVSEQVENWNDVVKWGYGGDVSEWEDLFPGS